MDHIYDMILIYLPRKYNKRWCFKKLYYKIFDFMPPFLTLHHVLTGKSHPVHLGVGADHLFSGHLDKPPEGQACVLLAGSCLPTANLVPHLHRSLQLQLFQT